MPSPNAEKVCPFRQVNCSAQCESWLEAPGPFGTHCLGLESLAGTAAATRRLADVFQGLSGELAGMAPGLAGKFLKVLAGKPKPPVGGDK